jgi:hypothetical protein
MKEKSQNTTNGDWGGSSGKPLPIFFRLKPPLGGVMAGLADKNVVSK